MGLVLPGESLAIADRVHRGDPTVGWRGDPEMDVYVRNGVCEVWQFDITGTRWCAVRVSTLEPGWQHEVLRRLRDSDWQRDDVTSRAIDMMKAHDREVAAQEAESCGAGAERIAWWMRRRYGHHYGGLTRDIYPVYSPRKGN